MSFNFKIFAGNVQIGYMPKSAMLSTSGDDAGFGDVLNSWALYTRRHIDPSTTLGMMVNVLSQKEDVIAALVGNADSIQPDMKSLSETLEVFTNSKGVRYVVLESETLDFGLVEATLQLESDYLRQISQTDDLDAVEYNLELVNDFLISRLTGALSSNTTRVKPTATKNVAAPACQPPKIPNVVAVPARPVVQSPAAKAGTFDGVQIASGFFGVNNGHVTAQQSPAQAARNQLSNFLSKK